MKDQIEFSEFLEIEKKLDIRVGTIVGIERVPKSDKLLKLDVAFGETNRIVVTNIGNRIENPENKLLHQQFAFVMNLKPSKMMGIVSEAMILVIENEQGEIELAEDGQFTDGSKLL